MTTHPLDQVQRLVDELSPLDQAQLLLDSEHLTRLIGIVATRTPVHKPPGL